MTTVFTAHSRLPAVLQSRDPLWRSCACLSIWSPAIAALLCISDLLRFYRRPEPTLFAFAPMHPLAPRLLWISNWRLRNESRFWCTDNLVKRVADLLADSRRKRDGMGGFDRSRSWSGRL